jgi:hypothetical protein
MDDFFVEIAEPKGGNKFIQASVYPEQPQGNEGLNEKGVAFVGSGIMPSDAVKAYKENKPVGVPLHNLQQLFLSDCDNIDDIIDLIKISPRGYMGRLLHVSDKEGNMFRAEISYNDLFIKYPEAANYPFNWISVGTGHFLSKKMSKLTQSYTERPETYVRYDRYMKLLTENAGKIDFTITRQILRDHEYGHSSFSICRHDDDLNINDDRVMRTLNSIIIFPSSRVFWVAKGYPCENEFIPLVPFAVGSE